MSVDDAEITDRRVLRGMRNREALVSAVIELIEEGELSPTATQIADRAGVAVRSIYHHFDDLDDVSRTVADTLLGSFIELIQPIPTDGPFDKRLRPFVSQRSQLAERAMPVHRASLLLVHSSPAVAERLAFASEFLRAEMAQTFAIEFADAPKWTIETLDALCSLDGWVRLRVDQRLKVGAATKVLRGTLVALLNDGTL